MRLVNKTDTTVALSGATSSDVLNLTGAKSLSIQCVIDVTTPTGATVKLEKSNNGTSFSDVAAATAISADGTVWFEISDPTYKYARLTYALSSGSMTSSNHIVIKSYV